MNKKKKKRIIILLFVALTLISIIRIVYVNFEQHTGKRYTYRLGEEFEFQGIQVAAESADFYSSKEIKKMYEEIPEDVLENQEFVVTLKIKNLGDSQKYFNITPFTLQIGIESGGAIDPYLFPYFNKGINGKIMLESKEEKKVLLTFPANQHLDKNDKIKMILSLYPEKYEIILLEDS